MTSPRKRKSKSSLVPRPLADLATFAVGPGRVPTFGLLIVALFGGAWYWGWQRVRGDVLNSPAYRLSPDDIVVTDRPDWMSFDIWEKVFHDASLHQDLSVMDPNLNERIAAAFSLHPWVAKVHRVAKRHPAGVIVDLEYHEPVLMVYTQDQYIPVDVDGNALPRWDIPLSEIERYPRLYGSDLSTPTGPVGEQWGDPRVLGAAEIAAALGDRWKKYHLDRIEPVATSEGRRDEDLIYQLHTRSGSIVVWGRAPGMQAPGEPTTQEKIAFLDEEIRRYGTLEGPEGWERQIDLPFQIQIREKRAAAQPEK